MLKFKILLLTLMSFMLTDVYGQKVWRTFKNIGDRPMTLYVMSESATGQTNKVEEVQIDGQTGSFRKLEVDIGNFVYAEYTDAPQFTTDRVWINGSRSAQEEINLRPQLTFVDFVTGLGNNSEFDRFLGISYNLNGIDILKYRPRSAMDSFTGKQIFKGTGGASSGESTRSYYLQASEGAVMPIGFEKTSSVAKADGNMTTTEYFSEDKFKKDWNLNIGVAGKHPKGVGGSVDFSYGETFTKDQSQSSVYYIKSAKVIDYKVNVDINNAQFTGKFINDISKIRNAADADAFVRNYGTHYPKSITYGGQYNQYTSVTKSSYFEAKEKNLSIKVAVEASKSKPNVVEKNKSASFDKEIHKPGESKSGQGSVGFSLNESQSMKEIMSNSKSRYYAVGGFVNTAGDWSMTGPRAAIGVEMELISDLIDAKILKSKLKPQDIGNKKTLVEEAIMRVVGNLNNYADIADERAFEMQVTKLRITKHMDDLEKKGKGFINAKVISGNSSGIKDVKLYDVPEWSDGFNHNMEVHFTDINEKNINTRTWYPFAQKADRNGNFPPLIVSFSGKLYDKDHCCGDHDAEVAELILGKGVTKPLETNQVTRFKALFTGNHMPLQDWEIEATFTIRPIDPYKIPTSYGPTSSLRSISAAKPLVVNKYKPTKITASTFKSVEQKVFAKTVKTTTSAPAKTSTNTATTVNNNASATVANTSTNVASNMAPASAGFVRIQNKGNNANYIHNQNGKIEQGKIQPGWWSAQWKIVPADGGYVRIQNKWKPDQYLHNQNGKIEASKMQPNWWSAQWKIVSDKEGWVRIQNKWKPTHYLHNQNGKIEVGPIDNNSASALWKLK